MSDNSWKTWPLSAKITVGVGLIAAVVLVAVLNFT